MTGRVVIISFAFLFICGMIIYGGFYEKNFIINGGSGYCLCVCRL